MNPPSDWSNEIDLTPHDAHMLNYLYDIKTDHPIIWSLLTGKRTSRSIALHLSLPQYYVLRMLRVYKAEGRATDREGRRSIEWLLIEDSTYLADLNAWMYIQQRPGGLFNPIIGDPDYQG